MASTIILNPVEGTYVVRAGGAILGESTEAFELIEADLAPVIYFPREALAMAFLDASDTQTTCPHKGDAVFFSIQTKSVLIADCAKSYENPKPGFEKIKGHLCFDPTKVAVEKL
jgi:uncharacterized protein (DUF427 family)